MNLNSENDNVLVSRSITFWFYFVALLILKSLYIDRDKKASSTRSLSSCIAFNCIACEHARESCDIIYYIRYHQPLFQEPPTRYSNSIALSEVNWREVFIHLNLNTSNSGFTEVSVTSEAREYCIYCLLFKLKQCYSSTYCLLCFLVSLSPIPI